MKQDNPVKEALEDRAEARLSAYRDRQMTRSVTSNWKRYAAATGVAVAGASTAEAAIVHVVPENPIRLFRPGTRTVTTSLDLDADGAADVSFSMFGSESVASTTFSSSTTTTYRNSARAFIGGLNGARVFVTPENLARNFSSGDLISSGLADRSFGRLRGATTYSTIVSTASSSTSSFTFRRSNGEFAPGVPGMAGLRFNSPRGNQFAWVRVSVLDDGDGLPEEIEVLEWAYEDSGAAIRAGAVPEPAGLVLLAAGAAGVASLCRRSA